VSDHGRDERFARLFQLLDRALALEGSARAAFVAKECAGDSALREELERLLASGSPLGGFLEPPGQVQPLPATGSDTHRLGEFEIVRELGRGSSGVVYLARQPSLKRDVALKVFATNEQSTAVQVARFHREAQAVARLAHPGIVKVFADGAAGPNHWFAMEYVPGHDLARELQLQRSHSVLPSEQPFLPRPTEPEHATRVARLVADVARALHAAHEAGIVHRDVKPENLLLSPDGSVRVGDFGLARAEALGSISATNQIAGTLYYMSPEQAHVERTTVDHRTDLYSLGVVLYELCTLHRPYQGKTVVDVFDQIRRARPVPIRARNRAIPRDLETICAKAMASAVDDRYRNAREFADDLERFLRHEAIKARPQTALEKCVRWVRRERARLAVAATVVVGVWFAVVWTAKFVEARWQGKLSVRVVDESGNPLDARVHLSPIDQVLGTTAARHELGAAPIAAASVDPGYYRITVDLLDGSGPRSRPEWIVAGDPVSVEFEVRGDQSAGDMVLVEGGVLDLTRDNQPTLALTRRRVQVDPFLMDRREVTNGEYRRFAAATGHPLDPLLAALGSEYDDHPVVLVTWLDAREYATWCGKRLPSYAEWAWAARGPDAHRYPWGDEALGYGVVGRGTHDAWTQAVVWQEYLDHSEPVGSDARARTPHGIDDLFGNVAEWTESPVAAPRSQDPSDGFAPLGPMARLQAGFDWSAGVTFGSQDLTNFQHDTIGPEACSPRTGFRCVRDLPRPP
jgi:formylglycine-generating enzyme required for sulfatase activity/tRNA A-37 threonylcarbamoyl transferase component Bud32